MNINSKNIHKSISIRTSKDQLWRKWTTSDGLKSFIGVDNRIELKPGGAFEIYFSMDAPEGERGSEGCQVLSFLPEEMLTFSWNAPPSIPEVRNQNHRTWVVVQFNKIDQNYTEITLDHLGWLNGEKWNETYVYFEKAWDIVLKALSESCVDHPN
jgi:uncharacterized protein YndB with AHSA1/START domain